MITIRPLPLVLAIAGALALGACARNSAPPQVDADARKNQTEHAELAAQREEGRVSREAPAELKREALSQRAVVPTSQPAVAPAPIVADAVSAQKVVVTGMMAPASPPTGPQNRAGIDTETDTER